MLLLSIWTWRFRFSILRAKKMILHRITQSSISGWSKENIYNDHINERKIITRATNREFMMVSVTAFEFKKSVTILNNILKSRCPDVFWLEKSSDFTCQFSIFVVKFYNKWFISNILTVLLHSEAWSSLLVQATKLHNGVIWREKMCVVKFERLKGKYVVSLKMLEFSFKVINEHKCEPVKEAQGKERKRFHLKHFIKDQ